MVVPGTKCSRKKFGKFFGPKKGDLEPGKIPQKTFFLNIYLEFLS
jgi:hypothetical protein